MDPHRRLVADYIERNPGTETRGFEAAVRRIARGCPAFDFGNYSSRREALEAAFPLGFLPDAFRVDHKAKELTLVEAEITSRISGAKWQRIADLYWKIRDDDWDVWVHTIDSRGVVFSVDVPLVAVTLLNDEMPENTLAKSPPGRVVWEPRNGDVPVESYYWYDAVQRRLGSWDHKGQPKYVTGNGYPGGQPPDLSGAAPFEVDGGGR